MSENLLEIRLEQLNPKEIAQVRDALRVQHINPVDQRHKMSYLKYDLTDFIARNIRAGDFQVFSRLLYDSGIPKEPMKRVQYGIFSTGKLPDAFLQVLSEWERVYFFAGRWGIRNPNLQEPIDAITVRHLKEGADRLAENYYVNKARGKYYGDLELPERKQIRDAYGRIIETRDRKPVIETPKQKPQQGTLFKQGWTD